jgi:hypothetical protein
MRISLLRIIAVLELSIGGAQVVESAEPTQVPIFEDRYPGGQIPRIVSRLDVEPAKNGNPFIYNTDELLGFYGKGYETARMLLLLRPLREFPGVESFLDMDVESTPELQECQDLLGTLIPSEDSRGFSAWASGYIDCASSFIQPLDTSPTITQPNGDVHQLNLLKYIKLAFNVGVFVGMVYTCYPEYFRGSSFWTSRSIDVH